MADYNSSLPIRTETDGDVVSQIIGNGNKAHVNGSNELLVKHTDSVGVTGTVTADQGSPAAEANAWPVKVTVAGTAVDPRDIRALTDADVVSAYISDAAGDAFSATNPLPVSVVSEVPGDEINDFATATKAAAATHDHDYTVTALKTLKLTQIEASGSGKIKLEVKVETGVGTGVYDTKFVLFNSTASPNCQVALKAPISVAAGVKVRASVTNYDKASQDVYSTISGIEI